MNKNVNFIPVASQVVIMGQPSAGGTVTGSYQYQNAPQHPEGASTFRWYKDGATGTVIGTTVNLTLSAEHAGSSLTFSVTPVSLIGEAGEEAFSEPVTVNQGGFQNISDEESENSFLKQRGHFGFHGNAPKDGLITSTAGAFAYKSRVSYDVSVRGAAAHGGTVPPEIAMFLQNNPAITMFSNMSNFGALVPNGDHNQLLVWGPGMPAVLPNMQDILAVYSNQDAMAFIYKSPKPGENTIDAVGLAASGGTVPVEIQNKLMFDAPVAIYSTLTAFCVLTKSGKVYAWGTAANGGTIPADVQTQLSNMVVQRIVSSSTGFCALTAGGDLIGWGANAVIPPEALEKIYDDQGAMNVIANDGAFIAITLGRRKAVTWGSAAYGGTMTPAAASLAARGDLAICTASPWAMCFINGSGQAAAWGSAGYGGDTIPALGVASSNAGVQTDAQALLEEHDALTQIESIFSTAVLARAPQTRVSNALTFANGETVELQRNDGSYVLLNRHADGRTKSVVTWGLAAVGGTLPPDIKQVLMASRVHKIYCSNGAYAALVDQGMVTGVVVTWGRPTQDGGTIPPDLREALNGGVVEIYAVQGRPAPSTVTPSAFVARKENGSCVAWGAHVPNEEFEKEAP
ncbi:hypothetical protein [Pseudomonas sp. Marseille-P9899]|uniref:hypothetical protein n=1 Tax=Pseudomonas sp. Marseille-P9899 TaxID=2730401 RepID=UPI00158DA70E|nr:hypothetical protein [Pseudomonas sp. Marseille-P9899]